MLVQVLKTGVVPRRYIVYGHPDAEGPRGTAWHAAELTQSADTKGTAAPGPDLSTICLAPF
jgi:hypothetical protein